MIPSYQTPFIKLTTGAASPKHNKNAPNFFSSNVTSLIYRSQFRSSASESFTSPRGSRNHPGLDGIRANQTSRMRLEAAGGERSKGNSSVSESQHFVWEIASLQLGGGEWSGARGKFFGKLFTVCSKSHILLEASKSLEYCRSAHFLFSENFLPCILFPISTFLNIIFFVVFFATEFFLSLIFEIQSIFLVI